MAPAGFEPAIPASEPSHTQNSDRAANRIDSYIDIPLVNLSTIIPSISYNQLRDRFSRTKRSALHSPCTLYINLFVYRFSDPVCSAVDVIDT